ncbi:Reticulon-like protein [Vigna angularis]|uniref:Reticulon-like protein n=1 Tax=Phaseolus angularis TaxID=3914 RepID=A0A8T0JHT4_PHAAN|nr:Reticulon-like protein [Vigna angularis]
MDSSSPQSNPSLPIEDKPTQQHLSTPTKSPSAPANSTTHTDVPPPEFPDSAGLRRRCKTRAPQAGSPRNPRKPRRRFEHEVREEKDSGLIEEVGKQPRKRKQTARTKKEKPNSVPPSTSSPKSEEERGGDFDRVGQMVSDLIMWKDASKSTFWFGFGSLCLLSSCFTQGLNFSIFSALSQFGILFLGVSFFSNSISQGNMVEEKREVKLKEDDILRLAKLTLPALNFAISKMRALFSGEPSMTLKLEKHSIGNSFPSTRSRVRPPNYYSEAVCHCFHIAGTIQIFKAAGYTTSKREGTAESTSDARNRGKGTSASISGLGTRVPKLAPY